MQVLSCMSGHLQKDTVNLIDLSLEHHNSEVFTETEVEFLLFYFGKKPQASDTDFSEVQVQEHSVLLQPVIKPVISEVLLFLHGFIEVVREQRQGTVIGSHLCIDLDELFFLTHARRVVSG